MLLAGGLHSVCPLPQHIAACSWQPTCALVAEPRRQHADGLGPSHAGDGGAGGTANHQSSFRMQGPPPDGCHAVQDVDRFSPAWWFADVPDTAIIPLRKLEAIVPYLRQVGSPEGLAFCWKQCALQTHERACVLLHAAADAGPMDRGQAAGGAAAPQRIRLLNLPSGPAVGFGHHH